MAKTKQIIQDLQDPMQGTEDDLSLAKLSEQIDNCDFEVMEAISGDLVMSPAEIEKKTKDLLAERKKQVNLAMDAIKLKESAKIISGLQTYSDIFFDPEVTAKVKASIKNAKDLKCLSEAYKNMADRLPALSRLDTINSAGDSGELNLAIRCETASGNKIELGIKSK